ncbi:hypothetical protein PG996_015275 [Apiospora saccharicola]|uniref:Uncharacterized protein n=1 Tax=Apiospora saccharicola TaxID=335842 RepID=A0ABR1TMU6_9PEZI
MPICVSRGRGSRGGDGPQAGTDGEGESEHDGEQEGDGPVTEPLNDGVDFIVSDNGEQGAAPEKSGDIVSGKSAIVQGHVSGDDESSLFTTDDEVDDFLEDFHQYGDEDGDVDEEELAADIEECINAYLNTAECKNDDDRRNLNEAKKLLRGWVETNERARLAEIKNLRRCGAGMSDLERECAEQSIRSYDSLRYGGVGGGLLRDFDLGGAGPRKSKPGAQGYSQTPPPWRRVPQGSRSQAGPAIGTPGTPGQPAGSIRELLRGFRFYDVNNREHAFGTSFPGTASHPFLSNRTERTRACIQSQHQPKKPDQTLVNPNLWAKFRGTDSWATSNDAGGNRWQNDCDYAKVNMKKWAERFCDDRDKRSCSFDGSCKENKEEEYDENFFSRDVEMTDAPAPKKGETFGTKGFKKPAWEFSRMPVSLKGTPIKSNVRNPFAPAPSAVLNEVKKKGVTWQQDLTDGIANSSLFTPKVIPPQQQPPLYQPPQAQTQTHQPLQTKPQRSRPQPTPSPQPSPKPSLKQPSADEHGPGPLRNVPMNTSWLDDPFITKPNPRPEPFDGNEIGGFFDLNPNRVMAQRRPSKDLDFWDFGIDEVQRGIKDEWERKGGAPRNSLPRDFPEAWEELNRVGYEYELERRNAAIEGRPRNLDMSSVLNMTPREFEAHMEKLQKINDQKEAEEQAQAKAPHSSSTGAAAAKGKAPANTTAVASSPATKQPPVGYSRPSMSSQGGNNNKRAETSTAATTTASPITRQPPTGYPRSSVSSQASKNKWKYNPRAAAAATTPAPSGTGPPTPRRIFPRDPEPEMNIAFYEKHRPGGSHRGEANRMVYNAFLGIGNDNKNTPATTQNANLGNSQFESARKRSFEQQQQGMMNTSGHSSSAAAATALSQRFAKGPIPGVPLPAKPTRQQQQSQHQDAARTVTQGFPPSSSSSAATGERPAKRAKNAFAKPVPYRKNNSYLRGGGADGSESDFSSEDGGAPLYEGAVMPEVAVEKARHAIRHAGPKVKLQDKEVVSDEIMKDADQPSSGQYVVA